MEEEKERLAEKVDKAAAQAAGAKASLAFLYQAAGRQQQQCTSAAGSRAVAC
jgi:hypothetical protein